MSQLGMHHYSFHSDEGVITLESIQCNIYLATLCLRQKPRMPFCVEGGRVTVKNTANLFRILELVENRSFYAQKRLANIVIS